MTPEPLNRSEAPTDQGLQELVERLITDLRLAAQTEAQWDAVGEAADLLTAASRVVDLGHELKLWEPGRAGWAAAFNRFTDALAEWDALVERKP